jgi:hypothetical protein
MQVSAVNGLTSIASCVNQSGKVITGRADHAQWPSWKIRACGKVSNGYRLLMALWPRDTRRLKRFSAAISKALTDHAAD